MTASWQARRRGSEASGEYIETELGVPAASHECPSHGIAFLDGQCCTAQLCEAKLELYHHSKSMSLQVVEKKCRGSWRSAEKSKGRDGASLLSHRRQSNNAKRICHDDALLCPESRLRADARIAWIGLRDQNPPLTAHHQRPPPAPLQHAGRRRHRRAILQLQAGDERHSGTARTLERAP